MLRVAARSHHDVVLQQLSRLELEAESVRPSGVGVTVTDTSMGHGTVWARTKSGSLLDGRGVNGL